jgi:hypothetical protein
MQPDMTPTTQIQTTSSTDAICTPTYEKRWRELTDSEMAAATLLGYSQQNWDARKEKVRIDVGNEWNAQEVDAAVTIQAQHRGNVGRRKQLAAELKERGHQKRQQLVQQLTVPRARARAHPHTCARTSTHARLATHPAATRLATRWRKRRALPAQTSPRGRRRTPRRARGTFARSS